MSDCIMRVEKEVKIVGTSTTINISDVAKKLGLIKGNKLVIDIVQVNRGVVDE